MVTKNGTKIWFSQDNEENPTPSPRTMFESQPAPVHCITYSSYLIYLYLYLYVKSGKKDWEKNKITLL